MEAYLEKICYMVDGVLAHHGLSAKIAGGYVAGDGLLLSLSDTTFVNTGVRLDIQKNAGSKPGYGNRWCGASS